MSPPRRLLSLSPNVSMILFALGADDQLVGRTSYCLASIEAYLDCYGLVASELAERLVHWQALPEVGAWPDVHLERAEALAPSLILTASTGALAARPAATLASLPAINFASKTLADLEGVIRALGVITDRTNEASALIAQVAARSRAVLQQTRPLSRRPSVLFEYCVCIKYHPDPERRFANPGRFVMVGGHLAPELIALAGGVPLITKPGDDVAWTDFKDIAAVDPDVILAFDCQSCPNARKHPVDGRPGWPSLSAVSSGSVYRPHRNIANPHICYPAALAELAGFLADWDQRCMRAESA